MARAMTHNKDKAKDLWGEVVNTACHIVNKVYFKPGTKKTPYVSPPKPVLQNLEHDQHVNIKFTSILTQTN